jgi:hypothetical protein
MKISNDIIGNRTRDLPTFSAMPQPIRTTHNYRPTDSSVSYIRHFISAKNSKFYMPCRNNSLVIASNPTAKYLSIFFLLSARPI